MVDKPKAYSFLLKISSMKFPKSITVKHEEIKIEIVPSHLSYELCREEGSFHSSLRTIFLNEDIVLRGGAPLVNVLIHEIMHVAYWLYNLNKESSEEDIVNCMSNVITEVLFRTDLSTYLKGIINVTESKRTKTTN